MLIESTFSILCCTNIILPISLTLQNIQKELLQYSNSDSNKVNWLPISWPSRLPSGHSPNLKTQNSCWTTAPENQSIVNSHQSIAKPLKTLKNPKNRQRPNAKICSRRRLSRTKWRTKQRESEDWFLNFAAVHGSYLLKSGVKASTRFSGSVRSVMRRRVAAPLKRREKLLFCRNMSIS